MGFQKGPLPLQEIIRNYRWVRASLQEIFGNYRWVRAACRRLSGTTDVFVQLAGDHRELPKRSCSLQTGFCVDFGDTIKATKYFVP